jgi:hypothetical protein
MKFDNAYDAVFVHRFGVRNSHLFKNQADLATAIVTNKDSGFFNKKELTMRSALSQVFSGERGLSKTLQQALLVVIKPRFDDSKHDFAKFKELFVEKIQTAYHDRQKEKVLDLGDRDYQSLLDATKTGKDFLITTLEPAELHISEQANRLKNDLLEKTAIVFSTDEIIQSAKYKFYLPDMHNAQTARKFWEELRRHAIAEYNLTEEEADRKLKRASDNKDIAVYLAPLHIALHPYVFINYSNNKKIQGFCVSYRDKDIPSVAELSMDVVHAWLTEFKEKLELLELEKDENGGYKNHYTYEPKTDI